MQYENQEEFSFISQSANESLKRKVDTLIKNEIFINIDNSAVSRPEAALG